MACLLEEGVLESERSSLVHVECQHRNPIGTPRNAGTVSNTFQFIINFFLTHAYLSFNLNQPVSLGIRHTANLWENSQPCSLHVNTKHTKALCICRSFHLPLHYHNRPLGIVSTPYTLRHRLSHFTISAFQNVICPVLSTKPTTQIFS